MFLRKHTLSMLVSLLLAVGCSNATQAGSRDGSLIISMPDAGRTPVAGRLAVTGLDHPMHMSIPLARGSGDGVQVPLPAGLYAVEWAGDPAMEADADELIATPIEPKLIVIGSGQASTVRVRVRVDGGADPRSPVSRASFGDATLAAR